MEIIVKEYETKKAMYVDMAGELTKAIGEGGDKYSKLANACATMKLFLDKTNWVGFYLWDGAKLVVGPFQGKPAVPEIEAGSGVCGTAVKERKLQRVDNVHSCCNHIACDLSSSSEIVVPIYSGEELCGVIDIDSPVKSRFDEEDEIGLTEIAKLLAKLIF